MVRVESKGIFIASTFVNESDGRVAKELAGTALSSIADKFSIIFG